LAVSMMVSPFRPLPPAPGTRTSTGPATGRLSIPLDPDLAAIGRSTPIFNDST
jgi:hypothetical protein